jgi:hypothetical protein
MKNPLNRDSEQSGLLLGSDPIDDVRNRRVSAQSDDDKSDSKDSDGMDGDSGDDDATDSDGTDSDGNDGKD